MGTYYKYPPDQLRQLAAESRSVNEILRKLGLPILGGYHTHISRQLKRFDIDTSHFSHLGKHHERRTYTREALDEAVASSRNMHELLVALGSPSYPRAAMYIESRCRAFGIDLSHFEPTKRRRRSIDPEDLRRAVATTRSIAEIIRVLGLPQGTSGYRMVHRCAALHGIDLTGLVGQAHRRGKKIPQRSAADILCHTPDRDKRVAVRFLRRALGEIGRESCCTKCRIGNTWQGDPLILEVDHINGDWRDNRAENLRYLCPNCHSQTSTFCGRNRALRTSRAAAS
ncbi:HNH endonuclease signature motif containing protein [Yinghuangia soli]|uniref:HNH endonuclease n=1 Tax=Yinghuangia soli TaxID=2908204 RepID=A0AA41Q673_9ACTN|nr:HNH endonuclease signature motif containing protein [Yinghuangia soli]MCF2532324.1 HNH endonuclease [Yinghuangia soli]